MVKNLQIFWDVSLLNYKDLIRMVNGVIVQQTKIYLIVRRGFIIWLTESRR